MFRRSTMFRPSGFLLALGALVTVGAATAEAQNRIVAEPAAVELMVGASTDLTVTMVDQDGNPVDIAIRLAAPRSAMRARGGRVQGLKAGEYEIVATAVMPAGAQGDIPTLRIPVTISWPAIERVDVTASTSSLFVGTTLTHSGYAFHADGTRRPETKISWRSSAPAVASAEFRSCCGKRRSIRRPDRPWGRFGDANRHIRGSEHRHPLWS